ncbi:hypothetical protein CkaCkLH20_03454 [Colletotrichum karsti]|uniref:AB hydrolase-1 domain-containing protein n=1 Tax=Colletotrichum karsti TaxID=1095194 RepID=A0A9P6ICD0_9PEZI|nr:uncharacterized protein CkaCkLH20_03454 [Colletotrichum karsti]KAF9879221.1 hypothetical protein CkaCkLH20_03454 [Colletotrichum karsti]
MSSKPVIVLTPGAWHSPECFKVIREELHRRGWETRATTNVSVGSEPPTKGMYDDAASARAVIEELADQGRQVVLVAHSYGGVVGAEAVKGLGYKQRAAEGNTGGVIVMLYVAAFVAPVGASIWNLTRNEKQSWMRIEDGKILVENPEEVFYADVAPEITASCLEILQHTTTKSFEEGVTYEPWHDIPCAYLACEDDQAIPFFAQEMMSQALGPDALKVTFKSSHSPFLSQVSETADVIERVVKNGLEAIEAKV